MAQTAASPRGVERYPNRDRYLVAASGAGYQPLDTQLTSLAAISYVGNTLKAVRVNAGETGFELATISGGAGGYTVTTKTAGYTETATSGELLIKADLAAGFTIVLPTAVGNTATIGIKKMQSAGQITADGAGAETIDGGLTAVLNNLHEQIALKSDGANWLVT